MILCVDTNVLVRAATRDDPEQSRRAQSELSSADRLIIPVAVLCEFVWVLSRVYKYGRPAIADALTELLGSGRVTTDWPAVEAGLALLRAGGDFADGVIAHQGLAAGADAFVSFDVRAIRLLNQQGLPARLPA